MINWRRAIGAYLIAVGAIAASEYLYYRAMPRTHWFTYDSVELAKPARAGLPIELRSIAEIRRTVDLQWHDTLYCDLQDDIGFRNYSNQIGFGAGIPPGGFEKVRPWTYSARVPGPGAQCYIRSVTTGIMTYGIRRQHPPIYTDRFRIVE